MINSQIERREDAIRKTEGGAARSDFCNRRKIGHERRPINYRIEQEKKLAALVGVPEEGERSGAINHTNILRERRLLGSRSRWWGGGGERAPIFLIFQKKEEERRAAVQNIQPVYVNRGRRVLRVFSLCRGGDSSTLPILRIRRGEMGVVASESSGKTGLVNV